MTLVYVTQTGSRYHSRTDAKCLESAHGFTSTDLDTAAAGGLVPCLTCNAPPLPESSEGDRRWLRTIDDWQRAGLFESMWEQAFARRVLAKCSGLGPDSVEIQSYISAGEETFKVDFFIPSSGLVLEVDGYAKDGSPPSSSDLERRNRRDASLQSQGLKVLHFSNAQVQQEPQACREQVTAALTAPSTVRMATPKRSGVADSQGVETPSPPTPTAPQAFVQASAPRYGMWAAIAAVAVLAVIGVMIAVANGSQDSVTTNSPLPALTSVPAQPDAYAAAPEQSEVTSAGIPPVNGTCPAEAPFKANVNDDGEKIVHAPGQQFYEKVTPVHCYATLDDAISAEYRASKR